MSDLLAEILGNKAPKMHSLKDVLSCHHVSLPEIERLQHKIAELELGKAAMADEIAKMRAQLAKERAAKVAILSSWKYSMMRVCLKLDQEAYQARLQK
jgi:hypothetical protein